MADVQPRIPYWQLLQDPRWQRKRLEILERDQFQCLACMDGSSPLHVHHGYYAKGRMPWEYEDETLHTLCKDCHERIEGSKARLNRMLGECLEGELDLIIGYTIGVLSALLESHTFDAENTLEAFGLADYEHRPARELAHLYGFLPRDDGDADG